MANVCRGSLEILSGTQNTEDWDNECFRRRKRPGSIPSLTLPTCSHVPKGHTGNPTWASGGSSWSFSAGGSGKQHASQSRVGYHPGSPLQRTFYWANDPHLGFSLTEGIHRRKYPFLCQTPSCPPMWFQVGMTGAS